MDKQKLNIAIIVHSSTGNTFSVAEKIKEKLLNAGHQVVIEKIIASNDEEMDIGKIQLAKSPKTEGYDAFVLGAPVRAFSLSPIMRAYLSKISDLKQKPVYCYLTQHFQYRWLGGNNALKQFKKLLISKNALILGENVVNWSNEKKRVALLNSTVDMINF